MTTPLRRSTLIHYGGVLLPLSVVGIPFALYVPPFYAEHGLDLALIGGVLLLARLSDVFTDPIVGVLSDRTRTRFGRRKPWIVAGTPLLVLSMYMLFVPPEAPSIGYFALWVMAMYLAFTVIDLPYFAWGAELSPDYDERSRITGIREQLQFAGNVLASGVPLAMLYLWGVSDIQSILSVLGMMLAILMPIVVFNAVAFVPEIRRPEIPRRAASFRQTLRLVRRNGPFVRLVFCFTVSTIGLTMTSGLGFFFVKHVILTAELFPVFPLAYFLAAAAGVPVWTRIAARIGKHRATMAAIFWYAFWASFIPLLPAGSFSLFLVVICLKGSAIGALAALPASMAADAIDIDTARSGKERAGLYFSVWTMIRKGGSALGIFIGLSAVAFFGFDATRDPFLLAAEGGNTEDAKLALTAFYSIIPAMFQFLALPFLWRYPLTSERQARIRERIDRRAAALGEAGGPASVSAEPAGSAPPL